jgi:hypothetical protein
MTPQEKAKDLFDKYFLLHESATDENGVWILSALNKGLAKKCALIAVEEIIDLNLGLSNCDENNWAIEKFYIEVQQEIEKL